MARVEDHTQSRKLATIVALDVAGYSARTEADEARTTAEVAALKRVIEGIAAQRGGRVFNTAGDGFMLEFGSSLAAVEAAFELAETCEPKVRVGVHLGDVVVQPNGDFLGHGVNVAARLMAQAVPGTVLVSADVRNTIRGPLAQSLRSKGTVKLAKMAEAIEVFALVPGAPIKRGLTAQVKNLWAKRKTLSWANLAIAATAAIAIAAVAGWTLLIPHGVQPPLQAAISEASIAVLPFADLSPAKDQAYFSDGMAEEILNVLAKVKGLDVASRTSSFQFKGQELGIPEIAKKLSVRHVVEGSVRKAGATLRITAQLIDTQTDRHLWSETFDRPLTTENIFTIQDEIARAIVKALNQTMGAGAAAQVSVTPATDNLTAYDLFLQARPMFLARRDLDKAEELLARAVEQDPNYADAWEMRAALQPLVVEYGYSSASPAEIEQRLVEFANRALAINPQSALAIAALGKLRMTDAQDRRKPGDYEAIIADFERAIAIDPRNASALNWRGLVYADVGNLEVALASFNRCLEIEPYYTPCMSNQVEILASMGRDTEALAAYRKAFDRGFVSFYFAFHLMARTGQEHLFKAATGSPGLLFGWRRHDELYEAHRHPERGYPELIADIRRFSAARTKPIPQADLAELIGPLGFYDITPTPAIFWDAAFAGYRRSEKFKTTVKNFGVYAYWLKHGFPPQCRAVGADDFICD
ncbi:MAG: tetratricopeptide repeat protein [Alphaproteobacteria bacterium]|nr:tetratricopeptide repeat protein [Alphaproteobacteria bacterium]